MRLFLRKRAKDSIEFGIIYGGIALLVLCAARLLPVLEFLPSCPLNDLTGLPCPSCGSSRSVVHLVHGDVISSITINPLAALCFMAALPYFLYNLVVFILDIPRIIIQLTDKEKNVVRACALFLVLANWFYLALYL
jgi:hypothetical protein